MVDVIRFNAPFINAEVGVCIGGEVSPSFHGQETLHELQLANSARHD